MNTNKIQNKEFVSANIKKTLMSSPLISVDTNKKHVAVFRKILEVAMTQGRWCGFVPALS